MLRLKVVHSSVFIAGNDFDARVDDRWLGYVLLTER